MRTAVFDTINSLKPYFFSLREVESVVSLDFSFPLHWNCSREIVNNDVIIKEPDKNNTVKLVSFQAPNTKEGYDLVFTSAKRIIKFNLEEEEKIRLFNATVEGLKDLFLKSSLDKLREITFIKDGLRDKSSNGTTELGDSEGQGSDGEHQEETN